MKDEYMIENKVDSLRMTPNGLACICAFEKS